MSWTWEYLHHGITWPIVQRVMADLPSYDYSKKDDGDKIKVKKNNAKNVANYINSMV